MTKNIWHDWVRARVILIAPVIQLLFLVTGCNNWTEGYKIDRSLGLHDLKSDQTTFTVTDYDLLGNIKSATLYKFEAKESFGEVQKVDRGITVQKIEFNSSGKIIENSAFRFGELDRKYVFKYGLDGRLTEENCYDKDGSLYDKTTYDYYPNGNLSHKIGDSDYTCDYIYDDKGRLIERHYVSFYINGGRYVSNESFIYNSKDKLLKEEYFGFEFGADVKKEKFVTKYVYDKRGNLIEIQTLDSLDLIERRDLYTYDKRKRLTEYELFTIEDGTLKLNVKRIVEYDDAKEVYRVKAINSEGAHVSTALFKNNFCIENRSLNNETYTEVTRFDKFNNWTQKVVKTPYYSKYLGEFPLTIWEREIEYY